MRDHPEFPNQLRKIADALDSTSIGTTARGVKVRYAASEIERLTAELAAAKRGEFICDRCHLRKDGPMEDAGF